MSKRALITGLVLMLLVIIVTQAVTVWLGSGNTISAQMADRSAFSNVPSGFRLGDVHLIDGECETGGAGGCPD